LLVIFSMAGVQAFGSSCLPDDFAGGEDRILQGAMLRRAIAVVMNAFTPKIRANADPDRAITAIANNCLPIACSKSLDLTISQTCCALDELNLEGASGHKQGRLFLYQSHESRIGGPRGR
jgi:hypothetical protein